MITVYGNSCVCLAQVIFSPNLVTCMIYYSINIRNRSYLYLGNTRSGLLKIS